MKIVRKAKPELNRIQKVFKFVQTGARINDALPTTLDHNEGTTGKQGGTTGEYNHLTNAEVLEIDANTQKVSFPEAPADGKQYARKDAAWSEVTGGGGGEWTLDQEFKATGDIAEIVFTGMDYDTYDYKIDGHARVETAANLGLRFYTHEANAAAVVSNNYQANRMTGTTSIGDSQAKGNFLSYIGAEQGTINVIGYLHRVVDGWVTCDSKTANLPTNATFPIFNLATASFDPTNTTSPTKLGLYFGSGNPFNVGTELQLYRKARPL